MNCTELYIRNKNLNLNLNLQVRARAYEEGYELLMERDSLIWRQDCSHILAANYTLFVYIHVPVGTVNSRLCLYEYLETPVRIAGQLMILSPREHMLSLIHI